MLATLLMAAWLGPSGTVLPTSAGHETGRNRLVVVTYNVGGFSGKEKEAEGRREAIADVIHGAAANLMFLQECREEDWGYFTEALGLSHAQFIPYQGEGKSGLALLSQFPLQVPRSRYFDSSPKGFGFLTCDLVLPEGVIHVINVHLDRIQRVQSQQEMPRIPWTTAMNVVLEELFSDTMRSQQVGMVMDRVDRPSCPVILAGDFNTIPYARAIRRVQRRFRDALWPSLDFFSNTYKDIGFPLKPRIDYIFHSPEILVADSGIVRTGMGDHYPVRAELALNPHSM